MVRASISSELVDNVNERVLYQRFRSAMIILLVHTYSGMEWSSGPDAVVRDDQDRSWHV